VENENVTDDRVHQSDETDNAFLSVFFIFPTLTKSATFVVADKKINVGRVNVAGDFYTHPSCQ
jgi:hypothetical protein